MRRQTRLFEIIQILRAARGPLTADALAERLEVSRRTVYRDIAALQAMRTPIEGEAGIGYVLRRGYDLPPLNFDTEEVEALVVGMALLARTGDSALKSAARRVLAKIEPGGEAGDALQVSPWGAPVDDPEKGCVPISLLRGAVREGAVLLLDYEDGSGRRTRREVLALGLVYHLECTMLAGWCALRQGFRHFRTDRMHGAEPAGRSEPGRAAELRARWRAENPWERRGSVDRAGGGG